MDAARLTELKHDGYCVLRGVLNRETVRDLALMVAEEFDTLPHMAHSNAIWTLRTLDVVRGLFERIHETTDLIVSFDGVTFRRPGQQGLVLGHHVDQTQNETHCFQALVALTPSNEATGTLELLRGSHRRHRDTLRAWCPEEPPVWQYMEVGAESDLFGACEAIRPDLTPGDVAIWDSRTVHAVSPPTDVRTSRLVAYICMVPRAWAPSSTQRRRRAAFLRGASSTHWPHRLVLRRERNGPSRRWQDVSDAIAALV